MGFVDILKKSYPFLTVAASMVPGGNIATSILGQVLKLKTGASLDDAAQAVINAPPEIRLQLQQEENRHAEVIKQMGIADAQEYERLAVTDRADARAREIAVKDKTPARLAWTVVVFGFLLCGFLVSHRSTILDNAAMATMAGTILGYVMGDMKTIMAYYFGGSPGGTSAEGSEKEKPQQVK